MNATLAQKLRKVVDLRTESSDLQTALKTLSTFYASNTPQNRNNLRGEIENRGLIFSKQFLSEMQALHEKVHAIRTDVDAMAKSCDDMNQRFEKNLETTKSLIVQTDEMRKSKDQIEAQLVMADRFLSRFQLTNEEMSALRKAHIDDSFFDVMKRIQQIHHDCKVLLRTQHQRAAIDVIDFMSVQQEAAYEKLYRWVLSQSKALDRDNPEVSSQLKTATRILRDRPSHFKSCMEEISNIRKAAILRGFSNALTRGGPNGNPRPIDMHAHDPLRYIGDMLAWLHQAVASEHEVIAGLIDTTIKDLDGPVGKKPLGTEGSVMLDTIVEGVCRAFNTRLEQVIATQPSPIVTYRLSNILEFYKQTLLPILGQTSAMIFTFQDLARLLNKERAKHTCDTLFSNLMKLQNDKLLKSPPQCPSDFSPPYILGEALESLAELMTIYETSLTAEGATDTEFQPVFRATLDPVMQACTLSATSLTPNKMAVYMINCLSAILALLRKHTFAKSKVEMVAAQIEAHMDTIVNEQSAILLDKCKLLSKIENLKSPESNLPLSKIPGMDASNVSGAMESFYQMFSRTLTTSECDRLIDPQLRALARGRVAEMIANSYEVLYEALFQPESGYANPASMARLTPDEVRTLLSVHMPLSTSA